VSTKDGRLVLDGDFGPPPDDGRNWPPFRIFGEHFYTYQLLLDLKVEAGLAIKIEPHPRLYTDPTDSVPIAVPALLRNWWPMMSFMVFKSPAEGRAHIFRPNEPFAQFTVIPEESDSELVEMSEQESAARELQSRRIYESHATLSADTQWTSASNTIFDATYPWSRVETAAPVRSGFIFAFDGPSPHYDPIKRDNSSCDDGGDSGANNCCDDDGGGAALRPGARRLWASSAALRSATALGIGCSSCV
jgi:hypothetical protein